MGQGGSVQEHVEMLGGMKRSGLPREERLLGASSRKIRHLGHAPEPGCAKTSLLPGRGRGKQGCPGATRCSPKAPQPPKGSPRPPGKHPPRCGRCRRGDSAPACGHGERSSAPTGRAPGAGAALATLPADGLLDGPLLQVDVVVEGGGALVIVSLQKERGGGGCHPCEPSCPSPHRGSPLSGLIRGWGLEPWRLHPAGSWLCQTLSISQPKHLPGAGGEDAPPAGTHRAGQVAAHSLPPHQLQADVDVKFPAVLDVLVAPQRVLAAGAQTTGSAQGPSPSGPGWGLKSPPPKSAPC